MRSEQHLRYFDEPDSNPSNPAWYQRVVWPLSSNITCRSADSFTKLHKVIYILLKSLQDVPTAAMGMLWQHVTISLVSSSVLEMLPNHVFFHGTSPRTRLSRVSHINPYYEAQMHDYNQLQLLICIELYWSSSSYFILISYYSCNKWDDPPHGLPGFGSQRLHHTAVLRSVFGLWTLTRGYGVEAYLQHCFCWRRTSCCCAHVTLLTKRCFGFEWGHVLQNWRADRSVYWCLRHSKNRVNYSIYFMWCDAIQIRMMIHVNVILTALCLTLNRSN